MTEEKKLEKEIEAYLHCPQLPISSSTSVLEWWKINEILYRHLSALSKKYFCICATSVPSERTFSTSGNIVSSKRTTTKPDSQYATFLGQEPQITCLKNLSITYV